MCGCWIGANRILYRDRDNQDCCPGREPRDNQLEVLWLWIGEHLHSELKTEREHHCAAKEVRKFQDLHINHTQPIVSIQLWTLFHCINSFIVCTAEVVGCLSLLEKKKRLTVAAILACPGFEIGVALSTRMLKFDRIQFEFRHKGSVAAIRSTTLDHYYRDQWVLIKWDWENSCIRW